MLWKPVRLPADALARMLRVQRLTDDPHPTLYRAENWTPADETTDDEPRMWVAFEQAGLISRGGRLDDDVLDTLGILARPAVEYFAWLRHLDQQRAVLVAAGRGSEIVIAYRDQNVDAVELTSIRNESLPETLIRNLPQVLAAPVPALNLRLSELASDNDSADLFWQPSDSGAGDVGKLRKLANRPLVGAGELYDGVRDSTGQPHRITEPIRYRDVHEGRTLIVSRSGYVSIAPGTPALIADKLREAHRTLTT